MERKIDNQGASANQPSSTNTLVIKHMQKLPHISRMIVLAVVMILGSYICLFSSKQIDILHNSLNLMKTEPKPIDLIHNNSKLMNMERRFKPVSVHPKPVDIIHNNPKLMEMKPRLKNQISVPVSAGSDWPELENKNPARPKMPWGSLRDQPKPVSASSNWAGLEKNNSGSPKKPWGPFHARGSKEEGQKRRRGVRGKEEEMGRRSEPSHSRPGLGPTKIRTNQPGLGPAKIRTNRLSLGPAKTGRNLEPWVELTEQHCHHLHSIPQSEISYVHYPQPTAYRRNECACTPVRYFVILSLQRSGTGWLVSLLNNHVNISSYGEVFRNDESSNISAITRTLDKVYNLDWFSSIFKNTCTAAIVFKWMLNQVPERHQEEAKRPSMWDLAIL